jgi:hypothetical protein
MLNLSLPEARVSSNGGLDAGVSQAGMLRRLLSFVLLSALLCGAQAPRVPLATFSGAVHGVSDKQITIETTEGNLVDFDINRNTKILRGKKPIKASDLETGDMVTIDARQQMVKYLIAVVITAQPKTEP